MQTNMNDLFLKKLQSKFFVFDFRFWRKNVDLNAEVKEVIFTSILT